MSRVIYSDTFTGTSPISNLHRDGPPSNIETSTFDYPHYALQSFPPYLTGSTGAISGYQYDVVQNIESLPLMGDPGRGSWSNEHPQGHHVDLPGPYSTLSHLRNHALAPYTGNVGNGGLPRLTTSLAEHHGDQTYDGRHHIPMISGPPRLEYYAPMAPEPSDGGHLGHVPLLDDVAASPQERLSPMPSIHVSRGRSGGLKISIMLEIND